MAKTSLGLEENIAGALCYLLAWLTGIIFFMLEKDNKFVKFSRDAVNRYVFTTSCSHVDTLVYTLFRVDT